MLYLLRAVLRVAFSPLRPAVLVALLRAHPGSSRALLSAAFEGRRSLPERRRLLEPVWSQ